MTTRDSATGPDELAALRLIALDGGLAGGGKFSGPELATDLGVSNQTASRRLRRLDEAGLIDREVVSDGQLIAITDDGERALREEYEKYRRVFEGRSRVELRGVLTGGMGEGRHYVHLPGYRDQFEERLGYEPFPGTLNLDLDDESAHERAGLSALDSIPIDGWEDEDRTYGPAECYPATIESPAGDRYETAHVVVPTRTHHADDQLELVAPVNLRETLDLEDGDEVTVSVEAAG